MSMTPMSGRTPGGEKTGNGIRRCVLSSWTIVLAALAFQAHASTYYVSPSGNDGASGKDVNQPWRHLNEAVKNLQPGDTLYARGGVYAELVTVYKSGTSASPINISAYPGETPVVDAASIQVPEWTALVDLQGQYIKFSGFEVRNMNLTGQVPGVRGVALAGANNTVSNLKVHHIWDAGIIAFGDNSVIQDSVVYNVARDNCRKVGEPGCNPDRGDEFNPACVTAAGDYGSGQVIKKPVIQRNTVYDCWGEGVSTFLSDGAVIQDNVVYNNYAQNLYVNNAKNALIQRNIVYNTPNSYVDKRGEFTLSDEDTGGTYFASGNKVINNLLYSTRLCLYCWTLSNGKGLVGALIAHNTLIDPNPLSNLPTFSTGGSQDGVTNSSATIMNNIVLGTVSVPSSSNLNFSNNLWPANAPSTAKSSSDVFGNPQVAMSGSTAAGQLTADYFKLLASSPAQGRGQFLSQVTVDFFGKPRANPPDMGAINGSAAGQSVTVPGAPIIGAASAGNAQATVTFGAPSSNGGSTITGYTAISGPGGISGTCSSSPCTVGGLSNGTAYTFVVRASNSAGMGQPSNPSNAVTPTGAGNSSYTAPASSGTVSGGATVSDCSTCSSGKKVGYIGNNRGTLQFNDVTVASSGTYQLVISYLSGEPRSMTITVNGNATSVAFDSTGGWTIVGTKSINITLNAGKNTIVFSNPSGWAPDIDRIAINQGTTPPPPPTAPALTVLSFNGCCQWPGSNDLGKWSGANGFVNGNGAGVVSGGALTLQYNSNGWFGSDIERDISKYTKMLVRIKGAKGGEQKHFKLRLGGVYKLFSEFTSTPITTTYSTMSIDLGANGVNRQSPGQLNLEFWYGGNSAITIDDIHFE